MTATDPPAINEDWIAWRARVDERLTRIETTLPFLATKEDLANTKWALLAAIVAVGGLVVAALKLLP